MSERLEEIKKRYFNNVYIGGRLVGKTIFEIDINYLIKQAERAEELENEYQVRRVELLEEHIERLEIENNRYKRALKIAKRTITVETANSVATRALKGESE